MVAVQRGSRRKEALFNAGKEWNWSLLTSAATFDSSCRPSFPRYSGVRERCGMHPFGPDALDEFAAIMGQHLGLHRFEDVRAAQVDLLLRGGRFS